MPYELVLGNKNYSSGSMRAWLLLRFIGAPFVERRINLYQPSSRSEVRTHGGETGLVPVLLDDGFPIGTRWQSPSASMKPIHKFGRAVREIAGARGATAARARCQQRAGASNSTLNFRPQAFKTPAGIRLGGWRPPTKIAGFGYRYYPNTDNGNLPHVMGSTMTHQHEL
jgi:hypothetical protein